MGDVAWWFNRKFDLEGRALDDSVHATNEVAFAKVQALNVFLSEGAALRFRRKPEKPSLDCA